MLLVSQRDSSPGLTDHRKRVLEAALSGIVTIADYGNVSVYDCVCVVCVFRLRNKVTLQRFSL